MGNKIIIDAEVLAKLDELARLTPFLYKKAGILNAKKLILENSTTISIDGSIDDRATIKNLQIDLSQYLNVFAAWSVGYKQGATEQSIIYEIKSKEVKSSVKKLYDIKQLIRHELSGNKLPIIDLIDDLEKDLISLTNTKTEIRNNYQ
jgi:hypothetical protein